MSIYRVCVNLDSGGFTDRTKTGLSSPYLTKKGLRLEKLNTRLGSDTFGVTIIILTYSGIHMDTEIL